MRAGFYPEDAGYDESDGNTGNRHGNVFTDNDDKWTTHFMHDDPKLVFSLTGERKARERGHILEGLTVALANIDEIIDLIKKSPSAAEAKEKLMEQGWEADAARAEALRLFGDLEGARRGLLGSTRRRVGRVRRREWWGSVVADVRLAFRRAGDAPGQTALTLATFALATVFKGFGTRAERR